MAGGSEIPNEKMQIIGLGFAKEVTKQIITQARGSLMNIC